MLLHYMDSLISTLDEVALARIDKVYASDSKMKVIAKSTLLNLDKNQENEIVDRLRQINQAEYEYMEEVFEATIDSSFNVVPAKSGLEFWKNQPEIIINGVEFMTVNEFKPE